MSTSQVNNQPVSSLTNTYIPSSATDIMSYVELMLVQDYDSQLKDMAKSIKDNTKLKKAYRDLKSQISELNKLPIDVDGAGKPGIGPLVTAEQAKLICNTFSFRLSPDGSIIKETTATKIPKDYAHDYKGKYHQVMYRISTEAINAAMENVQMKIDNLNSETELAQTDLSTVTSQRKLAFESVSSMISKVFEGAGSIVRNIK